MRHTPNSTILVKLFLPKSRITEHFTVFRLLAFYKKYDLEKWHQIKHIVVQQLFGFVLGSVEFRNCACANRKALINSEVHEVQGNAVFIYATMLENIHMTKQISLRFFVVSIKKTCILGYQKCYLLVYDKSQLMTKPIKWHVRPPHSPSLIWVFAVRPMG